MTNWDMAWGLMKFFLMFIGFMTTCNYLGTMVANIVWGINNG